MLLLLYVSVVTVLSYVEFMNCHKSLQTITYSYLCLLSDLAQCHSHHKYSVNISGVELAIGVDETDQ